MKFPLAILAGGLAKRLRPLTDGMPKALVDVGGEPFIAHQLRLLADRGIERVVICVAYLGEMIQTAVGNGERFGLQVEFSFDGPKLLGTAGALKKALPLLRDSFFVLYGDSYLPCDYQNIQEVFEESGRMALMTIFPNHGLWDRSNVEFVDGEILVYDKNHQTAAMRHIDYGLGAFQQTAFATIPINQPYDLAWLYQDLLKQKELAAYEVRERFYEIGSPAGLEEMRRHMAEQHRRPL